MTEVCNDSYVPQITVSPNIWNFDDFSHIFLNWNLKFAKDNNHCGVKPKIKTKKNGAGPNIQFQSFLRFSLYFDGRY